jgi:hypothetical protein
MQKGQHDACSGRTDCRKRNFPTARQVACHGHIRQTRIQEASFVIAVVAACTKSCFCLNRELIGRNLSWNVSHGKFCANGTS